MTGISNIPRSLNDGSLQFGVPLGHEGTHLLWNRFAIMYHQYVHTITRTLTLTSADPVRIFSFQTAGETSELEPVGKTSADFGS